MPGGHFEWEYVLSWKNSERQLCQHTQEGEGSTLYVLRRAQEVTGRLFPTVGILLLVLNLQATFLYAGRAFEHYRDAALKDNFFSIRGIPLSCPGITCTMNWFVDGMLRLVQREKAFRRPR